MKNNHKGFSVVEALVIFVIVGLVAGAGLYVWRTNSNKTDSETSNSSKSDQAAESQDKKDVANEDTIPEEDPIPEGFVEYANKDVGFSFAYPKEWGDVTMATNADEVSKDRERGERLNFLFSQNPLFFMSGISSDFKFVGGKNGATCTPVQGFLRPKKPLDLQAYTEREDGTAFFEKFILEQDNLFAVEAFEYVAPASYGAGACPGVNVYGLREFKNQKRIPGIVFAWYQDGTNCCDYLAVTKADADAYKKDGTSALSAEEREHILTTVKSIKELE